MTDQPVQPPVDPIESVVDKPEPRASREMPTVLFACARNPRRRSLTPTKKKGPSLAEAVDSELYGDRRKFMVTKEDPRHRQDLARQQAPADGSGQEPQ